MQEFIFLHVILITTLSAESNGLIVNTTLGQIQGIEVQYGHGTTYQFRNIPYAKPPVGELRFRKPQPNEPWAGVRDGSHFGASCMQNTSFLDIELENKNVSEDCLTLNVYVPYKISGHGDTRKSVMVWVHGGGYAMGQGSDYEGSDLALTGDVIVVTINYRLGIFGFLSTDDDAARGNYGLWDQHLAFKWVKKNIGYFGGNSNSITIFGESSGSFSVALQGLATHNRGVFHRLIAQSGVSTSYGAYTNESLYYTREVSKHFGCTNSSSLTSSTKDMVDCLRQISSLELLRAGFFNMMMRDNKLQYGITPGPVIDRDFIADTPENILRNFSSESYQMFKSLDFIAGNCNEEGSLLLFPLFTFPFKTHFNAFNGVPTSVACNEIMEPLIEDLYQNKTSIVLQAACKIYRGANPGEQGRKIVDFYGDVIFVVPAIESLDVHSDQNLNTYQYMFDLPSPVGPQPPPWLNGSAHGSEIMFLFGVQDLPRLYNTTVSPTDSMISNSMLRYWTNFAKTGNPNGPGLPLWPKYDSTDRTYLDFDYSISSKSHVFNDRVNFWTVKVPQLIKLPLIPVAIGK